METIQNIFIDSLNGFSLKYIPLFIFQLVSAALMGHVVQIIINKKFKDQVLNFGALIACSIALIAAMVKYSMPFSVLGAVLILVLLKKDGERIQTIGLFLIGLIGVGCGIGSVIQTIIGAVLLGAILLLTPIKSK